MNLSQRRRIVVFLVVLLLLSVAAGLVAGSRERTNTPLGQARNGVQGGLSIADSPTSLVLLLGLSGPAVAAIAILAAYMAVCDRLHGGDHSQEAQAELRKTVALVKLVSLSEAVKDSVRVLTNHLIFRVMRGETETVSSRDEAAYMVLLGRFTKAIQEDLGITPAAMQDPE